MSFKKNPFPNLEKNIYELKISNFMGGTIMNINLLRIDIAKNIFQLHGVDYMSLLLSAFAKSVSFFLGSRIIYSHLFLFNIPIMCCVAYIHTTEDLAACHHDKVFVFRPLLIA